MLGEKLCAENDRRRYAPVARSEYMRTRREQHKASWRQRREEYLRSSGRYVDLVREGYEPARPAATWTLIEGGRGGRLGSVPTSPGLQVLKGFAS